MARRCIPPDRSLDSPAVHQGRSGRARSQRRHTNRCSERTGCSASRPRYNRRRRSPVWSCRPPLYCRSEARSLRTRRSRLLCRRRPRREDQPGEGSCTQQSGKVRQPSSRTTRDHHVDLYRSSQNRRSTLTPCFRYYGKTSQMSCMVDRIAGLTSKSTKSVNDVAEDRTDVAIPEGTSDHWRSTCAASKRCRSSGRCGRLPARGRRRAR